MSTALMHGKLTTYTTHACRCPKCSAVAVRYQKAWRRHQILGRPSLLVDATIVREHIAALQAQGMSFRAIALSAGYKSRNSLTTAMSHQQVRRATMERILAVTVTSDTRPTGYVDATGTRRRLQALATLGHTSRDLATRLGIKDHGTVLDITTGRRSQVRRETHHTVSALYDQLWATIGQSQRTASKARSNGWAPPLAWDDDTIDNPCAEPDGIDTGKASKLRARADVLEDFRDTEWEHRGDVRAAAARLGMTHQALSQVLYRAKADGEDLTFHNVYRSGIAA